MSPADDRGAVEAYLAAAVDRGAMPGAAWWVGGPGGPDDAGAVGAIERGPGAARAAPDTVYDLASLTKPLATALLAVLLESRGRWSLDAPASDVLPELRRGPYEGVPLLDLGCHRAGLPAWRPLYLEAGDRDGYLAAIARMEPACGRGEERYSDLGYLLLGLAVERAGGDPLDVLFRDRVARPLGLERIGYPTGDEPWNGAAPTERGNRHERTLAGDAGATHRWRTEIPRGEVHDANAHALGGVAGHAGLFGDAASTARIALGALDPGLAPPGLDRHGWERWTRVVGGRGHRTFGFVVAAGSGAARGVLPDAAPGHVGFTGTSAWIEPQGGRVFVLLANRVHPEVRDVDFQAVRAGFHRAAIDRGSRSGPASGRPRH